MKTKILANLRDILAHLYSDDSSIRRIVDDSTLDATHIILNSTAINNWHSILIEAEKTGKINNLFAVVKLEYGNNRKFQEACDAYHLLGSQNRLKQYLAMPGYFNNIRKLLYQDAQLLPIEKYMFYRYHFQTSVHVPEGGIVDCIAVRPDTGGIRGYFYYFGSPYENPFDYQGNPSIATNQLLDMILNHAILICNPLAKNHVLHPCSVMGDNSAGMKEFYHSIRELYGIGPYGSIDMYLIAGQRIHHSPQQHIYLSMALAKLHEKIFTLNKFSNSGLGSNTRIEILSYSRLLPEDGEID